VGDRGKILKYDGTVWHEICPDGTTDWLFGVCGAGPGDVFAAGGDLRNGKGTIAHFGGSLWSVALAGAREILEATWVAGPNEAFAVGRSGVILRYDGIAWSAMSSGTTRVLRSVWGSGPDDVFAVGGSGTVLHYNGLSWAGMASGTTTGLSSVWGSGPNDVFAVGLHGTILHCDGVTWSPMMSPSVLDLHAIWGTGPNGVFAVGDDGTIVHYGPFVLQIDTHQRAWGYVTPSPGPSLANPLRYMPGSLVTLTATPIQGKALSYWEVYDPNHAGDANYVVDDHNNPTTIVMNADRQVTAIFKCSNGLAPPLPLMLGVMGLLMLVGRKT
jgi:hypothetical protein